MLDLDAELPAAVSSDPLLRLYAAVAGPNGPWPAHPSYPEGTVTVPLDTFAGTAGPRLLESVVRPLVTAFRVALDRHGVVLETDPRSVAVEVSCRGRATGRVVFTNRTARDVDEAARRLATCLDLIAGSPAATGDWPLDVWRLARAELRFLRPATASLLRGDHPLADQIHSVASAQDNVLRHVLDSVEKKARRRRSDPTLPLPAVMLDLDFVVLDPRRRIRHAARQVCGVRPGAPHGIPELAHPELLRVLPNPHPPDWARFLDLNGLRQAYPAVDFDTLREQFFQAFHRPWSNLTWDDLAEGVVRFVRDVENRGGTVVYNTGRRERVRAQTEAALARGGLLRPRLLMMPDDRTQPVAELKALHAAKVSGLDVVAVFDDLADNLQALAQALPQAHLVAVAPPGYVPGSDLERIDTIRTFERIPHPTHSPALSHATSIAHLPLGELRARPLLAEHSVRLDHAASTALVERLLTNALADAAETAERTRRQLPDASALRLVHHILTRKQFRRGTRSAYPLEVAARDMLPYIERGEPIQVVLPAFPIKQADSRLKALGTLPDLAELGLLVRFRELAEAVAAVYPPGLRITVLTDGNHFRLRDRTVTAEYLRKVSDYVDLVGAKELELRDIDEAAAERLGRDAVRSRSEVLAAHHAKLADAYRDLDVTVDPAGALTQSYDLDPAGPHPPGLALPEIFRSLVHSVPTPTGTGTGDWDALIHADIYNVGSAVPPEVAQARRVVLQAAWDAALRYLAVTRADHDLGYDRMFWPRVRLTLSTSVPERCGFAGLGGSAVPPWQGTAAVDPRGHISTDFVVHLRDQGFVPIYSPLLGDDQPWFMAPITMTEPLDRPGPHRLIPSFQDRIRLRRR
ncbi:L-tyrosine/L-tryptophan isonitrile synthase family protein [Kribbella sp. NPDC020789]